VLAARYCCCRYGRGWPSKGSSSSSLIFLRELFPTSDGRIDIRAQHVLLPISQHIIQGWFTQHF